VEGALGTLLTVLGITVAAAFVVAYFTVNLRRMRDDTLRKINEDLENRLELLERENAALKATVDDLRNQVSALHKVVTGSDAIAALRSELERHEVNADQRYHMLIESQDRVAQAIGVFTQAVRDVRR
jgi:cell division protein FtsB